MNESEKKSRLKEIEDELTSAKNKRANLEGRLQTFNDRLKTEYGFDSVKEAKSALVDIQTEITELEGKLENKMKELEKYFD